MGAIALVIGIGSGLYAGLGSMAAWRKQSNDASFALLHAHDLRVSLSEGSYARAGELASIARAIPRPQRIALAQERLIAPVQVDASRRGRTVLVPGRLVGEPAVPGVLVDGIAVERGRGLEAADAGRPVAVLESNFAEHYGLPASGRVRISGGRTIAYLGQGRSPEYFIVTAPGLTFGAEASFAVLFSPLRTVQALTGHAGQVNDLVLRLQPGASVSVVERALGVAFAVRAPQLGASVSRRSDLDAYKTLYRDADNDQRLFNVFAVLLLTGAGFAAFNLASRVVEAQRREIGIGMALGAPPARLAIRPLLLGLQIALLSVLLGVGTGLVAGAALRSVLESQLPLPVLQTPFRPGIFARGAAIGFLLPLLATAYPVWRGVRAKPIDAIRVGFRASSGGGLAPLLQRVPLPGRSIARMPVRNVLRAPRRTLMTLLGIGAVVAVVVALGGLMDSFVAPLDRARQETLRDAPGRTVVELDRFYPHDSAPVQAILRTDTVGRATAVLKLAGTLRANDRSLDAIVELRDLRNSVWHPHPSQGELPTRDDGILLSQKAAGDLRLRVGDSLLLRHQRRAGNGFRMVESRLRVSGLHRNPLRFLAYMSDSAATRMGLAGMTNTLDLTPAQGVSQQRLERELFALPRVATVQPAAAMIEALQERMDEFTAIIRIAEIAALVLALLIAFNSTTITADERAREYATMFAFGLPIRSALLIAVTESTLTGILGTAVGIALGVGVLNWVVTSLLPDTFPDLGALVSVSPATYLSALLVGVLAVALAPLLTRRRLRRMDISSTLRVME